MDIIYSCPVCQTAFKSERRLETHKNRKRPCKKNDRVEGLVEDKSKDKDASIPAEETAALKFNSANDYASKTLPQLNKLCIQKGIDTLGLMQNTKNELLKLLERDTNLTPLSPAVSVPMEPSMLSLEDLINKTSYGECVEMMKRIPANSIDMVCTDPPYFLDGLGDDWNKELIDNKGASAFVGNLPKGMKFDINQSKKFKDFYSKVSRELFRILKPGGAFISFSSPRLYHSMTMAIEETGFEIRDMLGWIYTQSQAKAFSQDHIIEKDKSFTPEQKTKLKETCAGWKTPQLKPAIEPMCLAVKPIEGRYIDNFDKYGTGLMNTSAETKTGRGVFPSNIITTDELEESMDRVFLVPKPSRAEKGDYNTHLSIKPVQLISHLVKLFTKENAVVIDPFMGSGTTAVACIQSKRRYVGFDLNKEYIKITERRAKDASATD